MLIKIISTCLLLVFTILTMGAASSLPLAMPAPAQGAATDSVPRITVEDLKARLDRNDNKVMVLDVRAYASTIIKGAVQISLDTLEFNLAKVPKDKFIVTTCACTSEATSARAAQFLLSRGYKSAALKGGQHAWEAANYPVEEVKAPSH